MIKKNMLILILFFFYLPILYLMIFSFNDSQSMATFTGFTTEHYYNLFTNSNLIKIVINSLIVGLLASILATTLGCIGALAIYNFKNTKKGSSLSELNKIMILAPDVVIGVAFLMIFTFFNVKLGVTSVVITHAVFCTPLVVIILLPRLEQIETAQIKAALDLGGTSFDIVKKILIPNIESAVILSFFTSIFYSFDDFGITFFVTGNGFVTLPIEIYAQARRGINLELNALSTIMFLIILIVVIGYSIISARRIK